MQNIISKNLKKVLKIALILGVLLAGLITGPALADHDVLEYKEIYLSVRPEFDQPIDWFDKDVPAVLVVNQVTVFNPGPEPITKLVFPAPIDEPNFSVFAVGPREGDGRYYPAPHMLGDGHIHIDLKDMPIESNTIFELVVQYYYSPLEIDGARKSFDFEFAPNFTVEKLIFELQLPPAGKNARVEPIDYGLGQVDLYEVNQANPFQISIAYDKADNIPTNEPFNQQSDHNHGGSQASPFFIIFVVALLIAAGLFIFTPKKTSTPKSTKGKTSGKINKSAAKAAPKAAKEAKPVGKAPAKTKEASKDEETSSRESQQKELRRMLVAGDITEADYKERMKKL